MKGDAENMDYYITIVKGNDRRIVSKHDNLEKEKKKGKSVFEEAKKGELVSCISGKVDENGKIVGQYRFYEAWF